MQQTMIKHKTEMKQEKAQNNLKGLKKEDLEMNINQSSSGLGTLELERVTVF